MLPALCNAISCSGHRIKTLSLPRFDYNHRPGDLDHLFQNLTTLSLGFANRWLPYLPPHFSHNLMLSLSTLTRLSVNFRGLYTTQLDGKDKFCQVFWRPQTVSQGCERSPIIFPRLSFLEISNHSWLPAQVLNIFLERQLVLQELNLSSIELSKWSIWLYTLNNNWSYVASTLPTSLRVWSMERLRHYTNRGGASSATWLYFWLLFLGSEPYRLPKQWRLVDTDGRRTGRFERVPRDDGQV